MTLGVFEGTIVKRSTAPPRSFSIAGSWIVNHSYASDATTGAYSRHAPFLYDWRIEYHVPGLRAIDIGTTLSASAARSFYGTLKLEQVVSGHIPELNGSTSCAYPKSHTTPVDTSELTIMPDRASGA